MALRISEIYPSYQGEGPNTGKPTLFVRFAGCNLKCPGWPCDTQHAIDPKIFTKEQVVFSPMALAKVILDYEIDNVCLTGGEVFLQSSEDLQCLLEEITNNHTAVECFTNGTRPISVPIRHMLHTIILDWKLPGSGEIVQFQPGSTVRANISTLGPNDAIKFTIKDRADYETARLLYSKVLPHTSFGGVVYCGVVWDAIDTAELSKWMLKDKLPWRLNVQVHKYIWHPDARRT